MAFLEETGTLNIGSHSTGSLPSETLSAEELEKKLKEEAAKKAAAEAQKNKNMQIGVGGEAEFRVDGFERRSQTRESHCQHQDEAKPDAFNAEFTRRYPKWNTYSLDEKQVWLKRHLSTFTTPQSQKREFERIMKLMSAPANAKTLEKGLEANSKTQVARTNIDETLTEKDQEVLTAWNSRKDKMGFPPNMSDQQWTSLSPQEKAEKREKFEKIKANLSPQDKQLLEDLGELHVKRALIKSVPDWNSLNSAQQGEKIANMLEGIDTEDAEAFVKNLIKGGVEINDTAITTSILAHVKNPDSKGLIQAVIVGNSAASAQVGDYYLNQLTDKINKEEVSHGCQHKVFKKLSGIKGPKATMASQVLTEKLEPPHYENFVNVVASDGSLDIQKDTAKFITMRKSADEQTHAHAVLFNTNEHSVQKILTEQMAQYHKDAQRPIYDTTLTSKYDDIKKLAANNIYKLHEENRQYAIDATKATGDSKLISGIQATQPEAPASTAAATKSASETITQTAPPTVVNNATTPIKSTTPQEQRREELMKQYREADVVGKIQLAVELGKTNDIEKIINTLSEPAKIGLLEKLGQFPGFEREILSSIKRSNPDSQTLAKLNQIETEISEKSGNVNPFAMK